VIVLFTNYGENRMQGRKSIITLTTDFGTKDPFAGIVKGVILGINPEAVIVDLAHEVAPQNVLQGAFVLMAGSRWFPQGTVHMAVVDPGVGGKRRPIVIETNTGFFVGPDNGVLSWAVNNTDTSKIVEIKNPAYMNRTISSTFHGRDIFATVSAHLSNGLSISELGPQIDDPVTIQFPKPEQTEGEIHGEVVYIDHFGNLVTNIELPKGSPVNQVVIGKMKITRISKSYDEGRSGELLAIVGSTGYLEISVNLKNAQQEIGARIGQNVLVRL
jgi:S-adenosyl-L-methionine hydrolase (adenosine-forming)